MRTEHSTTSRPGRRGAALIAATLAVGLLAASACSKPADSSATGPVSTASTGTGRGGATRTGPPDGRDPKTGGRLVFGVEAESEAMDPARVPLAVSGHFIASSVFDPLATLDDKGKVVPFLAKSIETNDDGRTWTITLPSGVTFHNGDKLDAKAVKTDLDFYKESIITGGLLQTVTSIETPNDNTVVVKLREPWVGFPVALTTQIGYVFHPSMTTNADGGFAPIGTGPFAFDAHTLNQSWKLKRNPNYWRKDAAGRQLPYLDAIEFRITPSENDRMQGLQSGDIDLMHTVKPEQVQTLRGLDDFKKVEYPDGEKDFLTLNTETAPFNKLSARRAVAYSIDVERWRNEITGGVKPTISSPFGPNQPGYLADTGYPKFDLAKAKEQVKAYETETGQPLQFTYLAGDDPSDLKEAQLLVQMMRDAGMKVEVQGLQQQHLIAHVVTGDFQISIWRNFGMPNPDADAVWWRSETVVPAPGVSLNTSRFKDAQIDEALDQAAASKDDNQRNQAYQTVARRMGEQVPYVWLGRVVWGLAANKRVNGIDPAANGSIQTLGEKAWMGQLWLDQ